MDTNIKIDCNVKLYFNVKKTYIIIDILSKLNLLELELIKMEWKFHNIKKGAYDQMNM